MGNLPPDMRDGRASTTFSCVFEGTVILGAQQPQTSSSGDLELACVGQAPRLALARSGFWVTDEEDRKLRQVWRGVGPRPTSAWMAVSRAGPAIVIEEVRRWALLRHQSPDCRLVGVTHGSNDSAHSYTTSVVSSTRRI